MRKHTLLLLVFSSVIFYNSSAQDITGQWNGLLKAPNGIELHLIFKITKTLTGGYTTTMDSPDQGATNIAVTKTEFQDSTLKLEIASLRIEYQGRVSGEIIKGTFKQSGYTFPLDLTRKEIKKTLLNRPQEPKAPFTYYTEDITFKNPEANIELAGTLTLPKKEGKFR